MSSSPLSEEELRERIALKLNYDDGISDTLQHCIITKDNFNEVMKLITAQKEAWQREAAQHLQGKIARYGDGKTVYHNGEAVVPISDVLHELVGINELKKRGE